MRTRFLHTLVILQLLLHSAKFFFGSLQTLLQFGDFRSMRGGSHYRRLLRKAKEREVLQDKSRANIYLILCHVHSFTKQCIMGCYLYHDTLPNFIKHTSKPLMRLMQDSFSPLSANRIFSTTAPIRARCSSTMEAPFSAANKVSGTPGWKEVDGGADIPSPADGGRLSDSGTLWGSRIVSGLGTDSI